MRIEYGDDAVVLTQHIFDSLRRKGCSEFADAAEAELTSTEIFVCERLTRMSLALLLESDTTAAKMLGFDSIGSFVAETRGFCQEDTDRFERFYQVTSTRQVTSSRPLNTESERLSLLGEVYRSLVQDDTYRPVLPLNVVSAMSTLFTLSVLPTMCYRSARNAIADLRQDLVLFDDDNGLNDDDGSKLDVGTESLNSSRQLATSVESRWFLLTNCEAIADREPFVRLSPGNRDAATIPFDLACPILAKAHSRFCNRLVAYVEHVGGGAR